MAPHPTPIFLLKTRSHPTDAYASILSASNYSPSFLPVLTHNPCSTTLSHIRTLLSSDPPLEAYGGLILTSQRAVEALASVLGSISEEQDLSILDRLKKLEKTFFVVGPATSRAVEALRDSYFASCEVKGAEAGNGEKLARLILESYQPGIEGVRESLLFLVGEKRRDVIPRILMDDQLGGRRIEVEEVVVYETGVRESFEGEFRDVIETTRKEADRWVVVFSPAGCEAMLKVLGLLNEKTGKVSEGRRMEGVRVASLGPTTRDFLKDTFAFAVDVCAEEPSPEGVLRGIEALNRSNECS